MVRREREGIGLKDEAGLPGVGNLAFFLSRCLLIFYVEKAKPVVRRGRKATGLLKIAGLPINKVTRLFS